jgi:hypothetical protein
MFGFKHTMNGIDHNSPANRVLRTRLYARLLQVNGPIYLDNLFPFLKEKLGKTLQVELNNGRKVDGMNMYTHEYRVPVSNHSQVVYQYL